MIIDGRYRVIETLRESETRTVFLTEHLLIKRRMVVKVLREAAATDADILAQFIQEAEIASKLRHPNIIESTDMGSHDGRPYVVFEHVQGVRLADERTRLTRLPVRRSVHIARQIAAALGAAHIESIVHGRLDATNVFLADRETTTDFVKVLGLGRNGGKRALRVPAPEQIVGDPVDHRADIWALGVLLYEMVMGRLPFAADADSASGRRRIVSNPPLAIDRDDVPAGVADVIRTCLQKQPDDRFADMADVFDDLEPFENRGTRSSSVTVPPPVRSVTPSRLSDLGASVAFARSSSLQIPAPTTSQIEIAKLPPAPPKSRAKLYVGLLGGIGAAGAGIFFMLGSERAPSPKLAAAATPSSDVAPAAAAPATPDSEHAATVERVQLVVRANAPDAKVTFRRKISQAPYTIEVTASDTPELVEVSAPGRKTMRYWVQTQLPRELNARLPRGIGVVEADELETAVALGEAFEVVDSAPQSAPAAKQPKQVDKRRAPLAKLVKQTGVDTGAEPAPEATDDTKAEAAAPSIAELAPAPKVETPVALPKVVKQTAPQTVAPSVLEANRLAGSAHIAADNATRQAVTHMGTKRIVGRFKVCVAQSGAVTATMTASSGVAEYDAKVLAEMKGWRFKPIAINGEPANVCAPVAIAYSQE
ncbi:MAG TPA: protein kinase [Kofleriaceae bacterium]|nr:protein kinase [Kofleriaceae bacterium]